MTDSTIGVAEPGTPTKKLQSYQNTISGQLVDAEAIVQVDLNGVPVPRGNQAEPVRVDPTGTTTQPVSGTVTANQGTPNTAPNYWPTRGTDGLNLTPTMDGPARAGFQKQTDGTNVLGTPSAPVRTDPTGTTTQPVTQIGANTIQPVRFNTSTASTGLITGATAIGKKVLLAIWNPQAQQNLTLHSVRVSQRAGSAGTQLLELYRITSAPTGGTAVTLSLDWRDAGAAPSGLTVQSLPTGGATLDTVPLRSIDVQVATAYSGNTVIYLMENYLTEWEKPFETTALNQGWAVVQNVDATITTAPKFVVEALLSTRNPE